MSKIALTPSATGTGVFTISSPATNTNRTLTLPDEAGTVLTSASSLASANLTGTVTVSGSNVGIGTSSPRVKLDLRSDAVIAAPTPLANAVTSGVFAIGDSVGSVVGLQLNGSSYDTYIQSRNMGAGSAAYNLLLQPLGGNVGIGTSSPSTQGLHILSSAGVGAISQPYAGLNIENSTGDPMMIMSGTSGGIIASMNNSQAATPLRIYTGQTERMRIDASGNVGIGTTPVASNVRVTTKSDNGGATFATTNTSGTAGYNAMSFYNNGSSYSYCGAISVSGTATSYTTASDYRLKTDAQPMTGASARVQALKPVNFEWISSGDRVDGFLAHEAQEVVPECVTGTKDAMRDEEYEVTAAVYEDIIIAAVLDEEGNELAAERTEQRLVTEAVMGTRSVPDYQGIDQSKLVPLLTAALQEALNKIEAMETRLAALEAV
jgi:hypothetical protein